MRGTRSVILCCLAVRLIAAPAFGVEFVKKDFQPFGYHTQEHFWLSAGGTFIGAKIFDLFGMENGHATLLSGAMIFGAGMSKEFLLDPKPGVNDIIADSLGVALGAIASVTIRFEGYFDKHEKKNAVRSERANTGPDSEEILPVQTVNELPAVRSK